MLDLMIPFNAVNGDRVYDAADVAAMLASVVADGVHPSPGNGLMVKSLGGWDLSILPGRCVIHGRLGVNSSEKTLTITPPDGALPRVDSVIIRCDFDARTISERLERGAPSSTPAAPSLLRDNHAWDIMLARVLILPTATSVSQSDVTDTRWDSSVCGVMHSLLEVDASDLFAQFESAFSSWFSAIHQESDYWLDTARDQFAQWLSTVQDLLDDNAEARLSSAVALLQTSVSELTTASPGTLYEKTRSSGAIPPSDWTLDDTLGFWQATASHSSISASGTDVTVIIAPDSLTEPVLGSGAAGSGTLTLYAARKPERVVNYSLIVTGVRD